MAETLQSLRERHAARAKETRALVENHNGEWKKEHQEKYDAFMLELDDIKAQINRTTSMLERVSDEAMQNSVIESTERAAHGNNTNPALSLFNKWARGGDKVMSADDWMSVRNATSTTTPSEGGYTVPTEVNGSVIEALKAFGGVREVATVISTSSGEPINYPTSDGTSEVGEIIAENTTATDLDPTFGIVTLQPYKFSSKVVAVPYELLQDSSVDIVGFVSTRLGMRLARIQNTLFTTGTGTAQPKGVVTAAAAGIVGATGQTTSVTFENLVDLFHSIDPAYRESPGVAFMMNDACLRVIRKLKDTQNRPVFLPGNGGLSAALPDEVLGKKVVINQDMSVMGANAKSILFGDFSRYTIRDVMGMTLFRFDDSAYAKKGQVGFLAWMRTGGTLTDAGAPIKYYQNSAT